MAESTAFRKAHVAFMQRHNHDEWLKNVLLDFDMMCAHNWTEWPKGRNRKRQTMLRKSDV